MIGFWIMAPSPHRLKGKWYSRLSHWYIEIPRGNLPCPIRINRKFYLMNNNGHADIGHAFERLKNSVVEESCNAKMWTLNLQINLVI